MFLSLRDEGGDSIQALRANLPALTHTQIDQCLDELVEAGRAYVEGHSWGIEVGCYLTEAEAAEFDAQSAKAA